MAAEHSPREASAIADMQPYARAFMHAHPGEPFVGWRFTIWMSQQWQAWAAENGVTYGVRPMTDEQRAAFGAWLAERHPDNEEARAAAEPSARA